MRLQLQIVISITDAKGGSLWFSWNEKQSNDCTQAGLFKLWVERETLDLY